jgi:L-lactate dehydrogenase (cytochrome)
LILKGVLEAEDAKLALAAGADAIVVSNHGGRQLDGAPSSISVLPEIVAAIDGRCEVHVRRRHSLGPGHREGAGAGARAGTLIGRSFLYALAAAGEAGVRKAHRDHAQRVAGDVGADRDVERGRGGSAHLADAGLDHR